MSWFNEHQNAEMRMLAGMKPEDKCYCGWWRKGECLQCPPNKTWADRLRDEPDAR